MNVKMPAWAIVAVAVLVVALVGALAWQLGADSESDAPDAGTTTVVLPGLAQEGDGRAQDATAKSDARNGVSAIESCVTDLTGDDYASCADAPEASSTTAKIEPDGDYTVTAKSASGTSFSIEKRSGEYLRTCDAPSKFGCQASGDW